jgi:hypothetical protein
MSEVTDAGNRSSIHSAHAARPEVAEGRRTHAARPNGAAARSHSVKPGVALDHPKGNVKAVEDGRTEPAPFAFKVDDIGKPRKCMDDYDSCGRAEHGAGFGKYTNGKGEDLCKVRVDSCIADNRDKGYDPNGNETRPHPFARGRSIHRQGQ